jgi:hypothetical protein
MMELAVFLAFLYLCGAVGVAAAYTNLRWWALLVGALWLPIGVIGSFVLVGYIVWYTWKMHHAKF